VALRQERRVDVTWIAEDEIKIYEALKATSQAQKSDLSTLIKQLLSKNQKQ